jgi:hypothetical protein
VGEQVGEEAALRALAAASDRLGYERADGREYTHTGCVLPFNPQISMPFEREVLDALDAAE